MGAVFKRELKVYFTSPIGYAVLLIYMMYSGFSFSDIFQAGSPQVSYVFSSSVFITLFLIPILTMRLFSEERRQKTDQALFTAPVKLGYIVLGKFFAALCMFAIANSITLVFQLIVAGYVTPDWLLYFCNLFGIMLFACALISIGIFISSLTDSQITAAIGGLAVSVLISMIDSIASKIKINFIQKAVEWISFFGRYTTFVQGIVDYANIAFFLSVTAVFLFLTVRVLEKKRWA